MYATCFTMFLLLIVQKSGDHQLIGKYPHEISRRVWVFPKIGVFPPKWMKIMENPINPWMIWGEKPHYFRKHPFGITSKPGWPWPRDFCSSLHETHQAWRMSMYGPGGQPGEDWFRGWLFFIATWFFAVIICKYSDIYIYSCILT